VIAFTDTYGIRVQQTFTDLWATSVQHQIDHLNGMIYADRLSKTKRDMLLRKARKRT
jgi:peptide deformylase